jgi:hypothetical protein
MQNPYFSIELDTPPYEVLLVQVLQYWYSPSDESVGVDEEFDVEWDVVNKNNFCNKHSEIMDKLVPLLSKRLNEEFEDDLYSRCG